MSGLFASGGIFLKSIFAWLDDYLEEFLVVGLLVFLLLSVNIEAFRRYVLNSSGEYSEEIARFALIWMVYLGLPYAIKKRRHIICDVLPAKIPRRVDLIVSFIGYVCFLLFSLVMTYENYNLVINEIGIDKRTEAMHVPIWYFSAGIGIGFGLASLRLMQGIWQTIRAIRNPDLAGDDWAWRSEAEKGFD